ncbi:tetratricopeptide repeat protein [Mucilaginibacter panaciglaebae]|uniref:Tetratricopeptide repeat protein n=1 Tax=Mucilaginibacter panaciglaebae TaxID=502331 RepID=A0ABP7WRX0_9SPHI
MSKNRENTAVQPDNNNFAQVSKFTRENQKSLIFIASAIVAMILVYVLYQKLYLAPREEKAADQMYVAQEFWAKKDWDKAIKGDAGYPGFEKIVSEYSNTKAANLASFYLGVAYLNKGEYRKAIENLNNYHGDDSMVAAEALGDAGDAYVELKDYSNAASYFKKAADKASNSFLSPLYLKKLGLVYEAQNDNKSAADTYKSIKIDYPTSTEAQSIDGYIARVEAKL